jgi:peptidoglycan/LPS O-acetylase OafA/YrhL
VKQPSRSPGLDAIRIMAITLVALHHFRHLPGCPSSLGWFALRGYVGVDLFFVLSGWLIGGQLWRELQRDGRLELGRFWKRRWLRTLPSYAAMVLLLVACGRVAPVDVPVLVPFLQNYLHPHAWLTSWSLCVEEHFYLLLPLVAPLLLRARRLSRPFAIGAMASVILFSPVLRLLAFPRLAHGTYDDFLDGFYVPTHLRLDGLALGVLLAWLATFRHPLWGFLERHARPCAAIGGLLVASHWLPVLTGGTEDVRERLAFYPAVLDFLTVGVGVALILPLANRWRTAPLVATGLAVVADHAYAVYLTHELARDAVQGLLRSAPFPLALAATVAAAAVFAMLLRRFVEVPALRWRERVARSSEALPLVRN